MGLARLSGLGLQWLKVAGPRGGRQQPTRASGHSPAAQPKKPLSRPRSHRGASRRPVHGDGHEKPGEAIPGPLRDHALRPCRPRLDAARGRNPPRPQRDAGARPGTATVYLIGNGFRRAAPHIPAYEALFRDWECIVEDNDVEGIRPGDPLGDSAGLIKSGETSGAYFVDGTTRRQVANPHVMDKYRFVWERVRDVPCEEPRRLPEGPKRGLRLEVGRRGRPRPGSARASARRRCGGSRRRAA